MRGEYRCLVNHFELLIIPNKKRLQGLTGSLSNSSYVSYDQGNVSAASGTGREGRGALGSIAARIMGIQLLCKYTCAPLIFNGLQARCIAFYASDGGASFKNRGLRL